MKVPPNPENDMTVIEGTTVIQEPVGTERIISRKIIDVTPVTSYNGHHYSIYQIV